VEEDGRKLTRQAQHERRKQAVRLHRRGMPIKDIATDEGWLYLAAVIDLYSRQVVGWSLQPHMQTSLVKDALTMA
jgi:transposase InsO family protein